MEDERWRLQKILSSTMYGLGMAIRMRINFRQYCAISNIRIDAHRQNIRMAIPSMDITILGNKYIYSHSHRERNVFIYQLHQLALQDLKEMKKFRAWLDLWKVVDVRDDI